MDAPRISAVAATSAFGRGVEALRDGVFSGRPAFRAVDRFPVETRRVRVAATMPDRPDLFAELVAAIDQACSDAALGRHERAGCMLLLAVHAQPTRSHTAGALATEVAAACGLAPASRAYTGACVAGTSALADAASMIRSGRAERVVVAAGYLVESDQFALFDAGRALSTDDAVRPFSAGRKGIVLGDAVAAVVLCSADASRVELGFIAGWGRAGDAYHVCQPRPDGAGLAAAIGRALDRAAVGTAQVGYVNAHGTGTAQSDAAEAAALRAVFGRHTAPVSSTKSVHGHALEASGLLEVVVTLLALHERRLPVNAGFLERDADCDLNLILGRPAPMSEKTSAPDYALTINSAFGGANTAILVGVE
ncbi:MAG TPA: beta-ketoacyl synthase N-terminal-like domain-containing protein [Micromonosporaceae bacterium]|jgi:3-oxoacyl-(acyl-carrier-protein) synthase